MASILCLAIIRAKAEGESDRPLRIVVRDGVVLFQGANLDVDRLRSALAATGRQMEALTLQVGPNAKSAYIRQVLRAVSEAGFARISITGPLGDAIPAPPETFN